MPPQTALPYISEEEFSRDGNAWAVLGACRRAYKRAGRLADWEPIGEEARSGDYDHLLATCMAAVTFDADAEPDPDAEDPDAD